MRPTIFIIEDDNMIHNMLKTLLERNGYNTISAYSGTEALLLKAKGVNLILLDLMLPGKSGEEIIKELKSFYSVPILIMSAISDIDKKVGLFEMGADDYITKPFDNKELLARIKVKLKHSNEKKEILTYKDIVLDLSNYSGICNNQNLFLTKYEFFILKTLMEHKERVITKSFLFEQVWENEFMADENTLNVHMSKIRSKLKKCHPDMEYIETIWSIGYRMKA